jgi:hypothetical protein
MMLILCFIIIIIASLFFVINQKINEIAHIKEAFESDSILFLSKYDLIKILNNDNDDYYNKFTIYDLRARNIANKNEYYKNIEKSAIDITDAEKEKIQQSIKIVHNNFQNIAITGFDGNKANSIPWKLGCIDKKLYESGLPHTRDDIIIISKKILNDYDTMRLAQTLAHEKVHIYQKIYKDDIQEYLNENNIKLIRKRTMNDLGRANPDLDDYIYKDDKIVYSANYNTEHPTSIEDITYNPKYGQSSEHPFEKMAIEIENKIF